MIYKYLRNIDNNNLFIYLVVVFCGILLLNRINPNINTILGIIVSLMLVYYINDKQITTGSNFIANMSEALSGQYLKHTNYFHIDSELVQFMQNIKEYHKYNPFIYRKIVKTIDSFLNIVSDMEKDTVGMGELYQVANDKKHLAMNALHSMIHSIPYSESSNIKYQNALTRLEVLLNKHIDTIYQYMVYSYGKKPINTETKFIYKNHPTPFNGGTDHNYDYFGT